MVPSNRTRGNGHKLKHKKFHLNVRKNVFTLRMKKHWNRLPREVMGSPFLEKFKTHLDVVLCSLLWMNLLWEGLLTRSSPEVPSNPYHVPFKQWFLRCQRYSPKLPEGLALGPWSACVSSETCGSLQLHGWRKADV